MTLRLRSADAAPGCRTVARTCRAVIGRDLLGFADVLNVIQNESGERCGEFILERTAGILAARRSFDSNISRKLNARVANITGLPCLQYQTHKDGAGRTS